MLSLLKKIRRKILNITQEQWFRVIFAFSVITRIALLFRPTHPWWDATVYQGMARYIASGGLYGSWELFRPIVWPLVLSPFSGFSGAGLEWVAKIITLILSLGIIVLVYKLGQKIGAWVGVIAAFLISFSVPLFGFSVVPMTEVPSLFLVLLAMYYFINKRLFFAGLLAGISCLTRFPTGLIVAVFGIVTIISHLDINNLKSTSIAIIRDGIKLSLGFFLIIIPFLIANHYMYDDALLPFTIGKRMITGYLWLYSGGLLFYVTKLISTNPVSLFLVPAKLLVISRWKTYSSEHRKILMTLLGSIIVFLLYFSFQAHKEFRYIVPIFPAVMLLASYGMVTAYKKNPRITIIISIAMICVPFFVFAHQASYDLPDNRPFYRFYSHLENVTPGTQVIASTPTVAAFSPVTIAEGYNTWEQMNDVYEQYKSTAGYIAIDTCELHACTPGEELTCQKTKIAFLEKLSKETDLVYNDQISVCQLLIYQIHTSQ